MDWQGCIQEKQVAIGRAEVRLAKERPAAESNQLRSRLQSLDRNAVVDLIPASGTSSQERARGW